MTPPSAPGAPARRRLALAGALAGAAAAVAGGVAVWAARGPAVPTVRVERGDFVRRIPAEGTLKASRATVIVVPATAPGPMRLAWLAVDGSPVAAGDPLMTFDATEIEKQLVEASQDRRTAEVRGERQEILDAAALANVGRDAEVARLEMAAAERFQKQDEELFSRFEIVESQLDADLAAARLTHAEAGASDRRRIAAAQRELVAVDRRKADQKIDEAERGLAALEVRAPHAGVVVLRRDWRGELPRVGDQIFPGMPIAEIPAADELEAEVWVLEADAGGLAAGMPATVVLDAHPETAYRATVARVDALAQPRQSGSPVQYFAVTLAFADGPLSGRSPGQRLQAVLEVEARAQALVVPRQAVFGRDGERVVYRRDGGGFVAVPVILGPTDLGRAVVAEGLAEGDEIALADPTRPVGAGAAPPRADASAAAPATQAGGGRSRGGSGRPPGGGGRRP